MKRIIAIVCLFVLSQTAFSQNIDSTNIANAKKVVKEYLGDKLNETNYILYNVREKYLVISEHNSTYTAYYLDAKEGIVKTDRPKKNKWLKMAFSEDSCNGEFKYSKTDSLSQFRHPHSQYIYYYLIVDNEKKYEFNLPAMYNVDVSEIKVFPVNDKVMRYFSGIFFTDWLKD